MTRAAILSMFILLAGAIAAPAATLRVADGDSFSLGKQRFRLHGIDAPELHQDCRDASGKWWPCGKRARSELRKLIGSNDVHCTERARDRFGRAVGICTAGGHDLGAEMVRLGWATAYPPFATPYAAAEAEARGARRGIWSGSFEPPRAWREGHPREEEAPSSATSAGTWLREKTVAVRDALSTWMRRLWSRNETAR